jgi:anti-sigma factor (TIGR02949 family)
MTGLQRYTCEEAFRRLDDYLDRELTPEEMRMVREHLETCEACATEFAFEENVVQHVRSKLHRINAPLALRDKIAQLLQAERTAGQ